MSDQVITAEMAAALHRRAVELSALAVWVIPEDEPGHPGVLMARLITDGATPHVLTATLLPELREMLPPGLSAASGNRAIPRTCWRSGSNAPPRRNPFPGRTDADAPAPLSTSRAAFASSLLRLTGTGGKLTPSRPAACQDSDPKQSRPEQGEGGGFRYCRRGMGGGERGKRGELRGGLLAMTLTRVKLPLDAGVGFDLDRRCCENVLTRYVLNVELEAGEWADHELGLGLVDRRVHVAHYIASQE
jgi:hypothetical protein